MEPLNGGNRKIEVFGKHENMQIIHQKYDVMT